VFLEWYRFEHFTAETGHPLPAFLVTPATLLRLHRELVVRR
jgi:hypothetical protein